MLKPDVNVGELYEKFRDKDDGFLYLNFADQDYF